MAFKYLDKELAASKTLLNGFQCTTHYYKTYGLPCKHMILAYCSDHKCIPLNIISKHWRIDFGVQVQNPRVVITRGAPKATSKKRLKSAFEHSEKKFKKTN